MPQSRDKMPKPCPRCGEKWFMKPGARVCVDCERWMRKMGVSPDAAAADREAWGPAPRAPNIEQFRDFADRWTPIAIAITPTPPRKR